MHFSKTYSQLLLDLPPELRDNAIQYRQLKKLINQVVLELAALGLNPNVLHQLLDDADAASGSPKLVYEFNADSGQIEPILRVSIDEPPTAHIASESQEDLAVEGENLSSRIQPVEIISPKSTGAGYEKSTGKNSGSSI
ncbi:hypothetical protein C8J56DRAFT_1159669 [Mycena floridula]|nr:hypothetical protein C8J56DRAFT_1159669 [Mycena floridula]